MTITTPLRKGTLATLALLLAGGGPLAAQELDLRPKDVPDACDEARTQVRVTVRGIEDTQGILTVDLYRNDPRRFLNSKGRLRRVRVAAEAPAVTVCMDAEPGTYAATTYHDENGDRDFQKRWNMMPKEPFGLSNDPELKFGFPKIEPSLFDVPEGGRAITITLQRA